MAAGATVIEEFEPYCRWKREPECDTLEIDLQGFKKDQLKVQLSNAGVLSISGERPLDESKTTWSRFKKEIKLPTEYKKDGIRAKLCGGVLSINMPKLSNVQQQPKLPPENQENERKRPETKLDTINNKESSNGKNITSKENSKPSTEKKMAGCAAVAVALVVILTAFAIYKYFQSSWVHE